MLKNSTIIQSKELKETTRELREFVAQAQRRLLEFEVLSGLSEIKEHGTKLKGYKSVDSMVKDL